MPRYAAILGSVIAHTQIKSEQRTVAVPDAKDVPIKKGRTIYGAPLLYITDIIPPTGRQLLQANVINEDSPCAAILRSRTVADANLYRCKAGRMIDGQIA